jgi:subtilase family serine protease
VTIAIVDAYDDPNIQSDLNTFSSTFGLPTTTIAEAYAQGNKPAANASWAQEISLDVEWAHALAPSANILLVEAASNSFDDLFGAVDYAASHGASAVSMSWGGSEFGSESGYDSHFNVFGVTFLAAAGDSGGQQIYPAVSPYVVAVGGTTLPLDSNGNLTGAESAWSGGGGGPSAFEPEPGYQISYGITGGKRDTPDVSYDANPNTGVAVYDSVPYFGQSGWQVFGGTSVGAPSWAALIALADQSRATPLSSNNPASSPLYNAATGSANYANNYRDITSGSNGYPATIGYDLATGLGSPLANNLAPYETLTR